jgi:hypothetical protein
MASHHHRTSRKTRKPLIAVMLFAWTIFVPVTDFSNNKTVQLYPAIPA